jgi:hypothetical protein
LTAAHSEPERDMHEFTREDVDLEAIRERLRKMTDDQLTRYGKSAAYMADPVAQRGQVRETYRVQLAEARAEWRRHETVKSQR